ncbi:MAG: ABC transporter ATP-binding protein [Clostridia bacterium]|nr:ABC transporter ATP-binding protein [Clostridia bacterium]
MITLENITVKFDSQTVISDLSFTFEDGIFYGISGPSGVGKTTLINLLAGLIKPDVGAVDKGDSKIAYIFQEPRLFGWMTALENVECVCKNKERAEYYLDLLLPDGKDKYPHELSGGMKQRVSIARALAYDAPVLLLDEPFKGLDAQTKQTVIDTVTEHIKGKTAILISHEPSELALCEKILHTDGSPIKQLVTE